MTQTVNVPRKQADLIRAELVRRLGLNPEQVVDGSLVLNWDAAGARVEWRGMVTLTSDEAADLFQSTLG